MINEIIAETIFFFNRWKNITQFKKIYKNIKIDSRLKDRGFSVHNESECLYGEIVYMISGLKDRIDRVLLTGEENKNKETFRINIRKFKQSEMITTGLSADVDFKWDFEKTPPKFGKFSLIISQAMFEHLMDPYKHFCDLANHLRPGGTLIIHTVMPGFFYHRHPIDSLRYYPDWFEEMASPKRCNLKITGRLIRNLHLFYMYKKP